MKNLLTIIKKELRRFFTDKRMLAALLLPGILVFVLYSIMGDTMSKIGTGDGVTYKIRIDNDPDNYRFPIGDNYEYLEDDPALDTADYEKMISDETLHLYVIYAPDWTLKLANGEKPEIVFYYNSGSLDSLTVMSQYSEFLNAITTPYIMGTTDLAEGNDATLMIMTSLLPFLLVTFLFSGSMAVAPESIAGEKERGTIATLLITPVKRSTIALGKIIALSIVAMVSATSSFLGIILSLPKLAGTSISISLYSFGTYVALLFVLLSTILVFIMLISVISAYAKSIKEASGLATPLMIIIMAVGVSTMFGKATTNPFMYLVPILNSVNTLLTLFAGEFSAVPFMLTIASNIALTAVGVYLLTRMFNSEKMMFRK